MNWACAFHSDCADPVKAAVITAIVAILTLLFNSAISILVWRTTRRHNEAVRQHNQAVIRQNDELAEESHKRAREIEALRRTLDLRTETRRQQLARLRELQRAAERIQQQAVEMSNLQRSLGGQRRSAAAIDGFVGAAGEFLRVAAGIFVPPADGVANLPLPCNAPFKELRRAVVKVTLLLDIQEDAHSDARAEAMDRALQGLNAAVSAFVEVIQVEESKPIEDTPSCPSVA